MTISRVVLSFVGLLAAGTAYGAKCPDAKTAYDGFVLDRPGVHSEFHPSAEMVVQVANTFDSAPPQTHFYLGGLIEVLRSSDKGRFSMLPFSDLRSIFPLQPGDSHEITLMHLEADKKVEKPLTLALEVTGEESFSLGDCKYEVLAVRQTMTAADGGNIDTWTSLYSPDLQAVLARRYDEGTAQESVIGYEAIQPLAE